MLRQEDPHPNSDTASAAQTRVTPEELAHAIASLEARKLDEVRLQENTIPIGQAVRELNLDATPEEVLAEVRAQRQAQAATPSPTQASPSAAHTPPAPPPIPVPPLHRTVTDALRQAAVAAAPGLRDAARAASPALKQGMDAVSRHVKQPKTKMQVRRKRPWAAFGIFFAIIGIVNSSGHHRHTHVGGGPSYVSLSTVPDGHEVYANTDTVLSIARGANPQTIAVQDGTGMDNGWRLIRHDKHWYVRGYVLDDAELGANAIKVYNDNDAGILHDKRDKDVTLRLDTSPITDTHAGDDWSEIDVSQVHPDAYTHEGW